MSGSAGVDAFKLAFELSPIILTNGVANNIPGGMLPIIAITQSVDFVTGLLGGSVSASPDDFIAHFYPMPGSTLIDQQVATYPMANQTVAANATIAQPLTLSMLMECPARGSGGYASKLAVIMALQTTLQAHNSQGGTYIVITPSFFYTNMIMTTMRDASRGGSHQAQTAYQIDFIQPLLTLNQANSVQGSLMSQITGGTQVSDNPAWSGLSPTVGAPNSLVAPGIIPSSVGSPGAGTSPVNDGFLA